MPDTFDRIRAADPARALPEETEAERRAAEALLERLVAEPVEQPRRRRLPRPRTFAVTAAAAAAIAAVFALIVPDDEHVPTGLATRAYALTNPADRIVHEVVEWRFRGNDSNPPVNVRGERWLRPSTGEYRWVWRSGKVVGEVAVDRGGTQRRWSPQLEPKVEVTRAPDLSDLPPTEPRPDASAVQQFRRAYERGLLRDAGPSEYRGRPTRRYVAERREKARRVPSGVGKGTVRQPAIRETESWEIDAKTALPLAMSVRRTILYATQPTDRQRIDQRILRYEKLAPTTENLDKLRFVGPPR